MNHPNPVRRRIVAALGVLVSTPVFVHAKGLTPTPPLTMPFAANKKGEVIDINLRVKEHRDYMFVLRFGIRGRAPDKPNVVERLTRHKEGDPEDRRRVERLINESYFDAQGRFRRRNELLLTLRVVDIGADQIRTVFDEKIDRYLGGGHGGKTLYRDIATVILKPGLYRVRIESLQDVPALDSVPIEFSVGWYPKSGPISK